MIKCYLVTANYDNMDYQTRGGKFIKRKDYIAKVSNKSPNMVSVLDENHNWIPFNMIDDKCSITRRYRIFEKCFTINMTFFAENKKSLTDLFGREGSKSFKYATAIHEIDDRLLDYRLFTRLAYLMDDIAYKNKFVI